jgi:hypothetical protein
VAKEARALKRAVEPMRWYDDALFVETKDSLQGKFLIQFF